MGGEKERRWRERRWKRRRKGEREWVGKKGSMIEEKGAVDKECGEKEGGRGGGRGGKKGEKGEKVNMCAGKKFA